MYSFSIWFLILFSSFVSYGSYPTLILKNQFGEQSDNWVLGGTFGGGGGTGTVTNVGLSMPPLFTVTGSPITGSGTFGVSLTGTLGVSNGGTGASTGTLALDSLSGLSGSVIGLLSRNSVGAWALNTLGITNTLYVSKNGNDTTGNGTYANPYLTIGKAVTVASSGSDVIIFKGTYSENVTLKAGVSLSCSESRGVAIVGSMTANFAGTVYIHHCDLAGAGTVLTISGSSALNLQLDDTHMDSLAGLGDAVIYSNSNAASKFNADNCAITAALTTSTKAMTVSGAGSIYFEDVSVENLDNPDHVAIALGGAVSFVHNQDQVQGQITVSSTAAYSGVNLKLITATVPSLVTNSTGISSLSQVIHYSSASPLVTGAGAFAQALNIYLGTGQGFATTLNAGAGASPVPMSSFQLHSQTLTPLVYDGAQEYDGTHLWFSIGSTKYQLDRQLASASSPLSLSSGTLSIQASSSSLNGYLSSTDWTTFNAKMTNVGSLTLKTIYVAVWGNDTTGDGSVGNPYHLPSKALSTITGPFDQDHHWVIRLAPGRYIETADLLIPPYTDIIGDGHRSAYLRVNGGTNSIKPTSDWATGSSWTTFKSLYLGGSTQLNFDLQAIGGSNSNVVIQDCWIGGAVTWKGRNAGGGDYIEAYDTFTFGAVSLDQTLIQWQGGVFANTLTHGCSLAPCSGTFINSNFNADVTLNGTFIDTMQFSASPFGSTGINLTTTGTVALLADKISVPPIASQVLSVSTVVTKMGDTLTQIDVQGAGVTPTCSAARNGILSLTSAYVLCVCNGSSWVKTVDGSTACTF